MLKFRRSTSADPSDPRVLSGLSGGVDNAVDQLDGDRCEPNSFAGAAKTGSVFDSEERQMLTAHYPIAGAGEEAVGLMVEGQRVVRAKINICSNIAVLNSNNKHAEQFSPLPKHNFVPFRSNRRNIANKSSSLRAILH